MPNDDLPPVPETREPFYQEPAQFVLATVVSEPPEEEVRPLPFRRRWKLPLALFLATCLSTYLVGGGVYALCLMTILVCHEAGHYLQTRRYGVLATYPIFLPLPVPPIGTFGAVIAMDARIKDRKALFDIGISGPLAGLVPTLVFCVLGLYYFSEPGPIRPDASQFGDPLLLKLLFRLRFGSLPQGHDVYMGPMGIAAWVGLLITSLNLFPIGQLDGGHVLYALLRRRAHPIAIFLLFGAMAAVVWLEYYWWTLMVVLLLFFGPKHPPTANDNVPLGPVRVALGWLTLGFLVLGFTPNPFALEPVPLLNRIW
jgi:membrane-associated protease RseP (regulator of RpoE activity)